MSLELSTVINKFVSYFCKYKINEINNHHIGSFKRCNSEAYNEIQKIITEDLSESNFAQSFIKLLQELDYEPQEFSIALVGFIQVLIECGTTKSIGKHSKLSESDLHYLASLIDQLRNINGFSYANPLNSNSQTPAATPTDSQMEIILNNLSSVNSSLASVSSGNSDILELIRQELTKYLGTNKQLTSAEVNDHCKKLGYVLQKLLKRQNSIKIARSHINNKTTPKDLCHQSFPRPYETIRHKQIFVDNHNKIIEDAQAKMLDNAILSFEEDIEMLENDVKVYTSILKHHIHNFDDYKAKLKEQQEKRLENSFKSSSVKVSKAKACPYKIGKESTFEPTPDQVDGSLIDTNSESNHSRTNKDRHISFSKNNRNHNKKGTNNNANREQGRHNSKSRSASRSNSKARASNNHNNIPLLNTFPSSSNYQSSSSSFNQNQTLNNTSFNNSNYVNKNSTLASNSNNAKSNQNSFFRKRYNHPSKS